MIASRFSLLVATLLLSACSSGIQEEQTEDIVRQDPANNENPGDEPEAPSDYYIKEAEATAETIKTLTGAPCLVFSILTDSHENLEDPESMALVDSTFTNISRVNNLVKSDGIVHLGDLLAAADTINYADWAGVNRHLASSIDRLRKINPSCYVILGNHDGILGNYVDEMRVYDTVYAFNDADVVRDGRSPWYYKDYPDVKTRVAFLSVPSRDGIMDGAPLYGFQMRQMQWIANSVLNVDSGWRVLFMGHISPCQPNGGFVAKSRDVFAPLTSAFVNHQKYENKEWGISVDYSVKDDVSILAYVCGHAHADAVISDNSVFTDYCFSFPVIVIGACNRIVSGNPNEGYYDPRREPGTVTDDLWDTMVYRPDLNKLFFVRFGAGLDRSVECN